MKNVFNFLTLLLAASMLFVSCSSDDDGGLPLGAYENGVFILNEGNFGASNASVSFIDAAGVVHQNIYASVNGTGLGDTAQSMGFEDDLAYIVLNGSNTIVVVNRYTFKHTATISSGLMSPRSIVFENGKGFVSNWGDPSNPDDDFIAVIDLASNAVESTIAVVEGPEKMLQANGSLYVAHKGGYGFGNSVSVISLSGSAVTSNIGVADVPDALEESDGFLYVLSSGKPEWSGEETPGALTKINLSDNTVVETAIFEEGLHPTHLKIQNNTVYYTIDSGVYSKGIDVALPATPVFNVSDQGVYGIYGFEVMDDQIYVGDAKDYSANGEAFLYSLTGTLLDSHMTGIIPNGFYFNE